MTGMRNSQAAITCAREPWFTAMAGPVSTPVQRKPEGADDRGHCPGEKETRRAVPADHHVAKTMGLSNLFHLAEAPGGDEHFIASLFEPP